MPREESQVRGNRLAAMASYVRECDPIELEELREACAAATSTNCGWDSFKAAQYLLEEIRMWSAYVKRQAEIQNTNQ